MTGPESVYSSEWEDVEVDWLTLEGDIVQIERRKLVGLEDSSLSKHYRVTVGRTSTARSKRANVIFDGAPADLKFQLVIEPQQCRVAGEVGPGASLHATGRVRTLQVDAAIERVTTDRPLTLTIPSVPDLIVTSSGNSLVLSPPVVADEGSAVDTEVSVHMTATSGEVSVAGTAVVGRLSVDSVDAATLEAPVRLGATLSAAGGLTVKSALPNLVKVTATRLDVVKAAGTGTYRCAVGTFQGGVQGQPTQPAVIEQLASKDEGTSLDNSPLAVKGNLCEATVVWRGPLEVSDSITNCDQVQIAGPVSVTGDVKDSEVTGRTVNVGGQAANATIRATADCSIAADVTSCTVQAGGRIHISGNVADGSDLTSEDGHQFAVTVGSGVKDHRSLPDITFDHREVETARPIDAGTINNQPRTKNGCISNSRVTASHGGVSCREAVGSEFVVAETLRALDRLDVDASIKAAHVRSATTMVTPSNQHYLDEVGHLAVKVLHIAGHISTLKRLTCNELAPEKGPIRLDAEHIDIRHAAHGEPNLRATSELALRTEAEDSALTLQSVGGRVTVFGFVVKRARLTGAVHAVFRSYVESLQAEGDCTVDLDREGHIAEGHVEGGLKLVLPSPTELEVDLRSKAFKLLVTDEAKVSPHESAGLRLLLTLAREAAAELYVRQKDGDQNVLSIACIGNDPEVPSLWAHTTAGTALRIRGPRSALPTSAPSLTIDGDLKARVEGTIGALDASHKSGASPLVATAFETDVVHEATGELRLGPFPGTLFGSDEPGQSLVIREVKKQPDSDSGTSGKLQDVDITRLASVDLERLRPFEIVEPTATSLRALGERDPFVPEPDVRTEAGVRRDLRALAERARLINQLIEGRAVSGSSRAAAKWAEARLHHRSINPDKWEWKVRWVPWALGYGQRPEFPLCTLALLYTAVVATRITCWAFDGQAGYCEGQPMADSGYLTTALSALSQTLQQPFTLVQFGRASDALFFNNLANLATSVVLGIPFLFLIVSFKNYLSLKDT